MLILLLIIVVLLVFVLIIGYFIFDLDVFIYSSGLLVVLFLISLLFYKSEHRNTEIKDHINDVSHSYAIYIDGVEVDIDNIDIDNYELNQIKVDDENEKIYITLNK